MLIILLASIFSSILLPTIGCVLVWNRYANLGDGIIHILLLSALINAITHTPLFVATAIVAIAFVLLSTCLKLYFNEHNIVLNIATTSLIALGIVISDRLNISLEIESILLGDIFLANRQDVYLLATLAAIVGVLLYKYFNTIIILSINEELAFSYGIKTQTLHLAILFIAALCISALVQVIGGLMVNSLLLIPVFFARMISNTPGKMLAVSIFFSVIVNLASLVIGITLDLPVAATNILAQMSILFLTFCSKKYIFDL